MARSLRLRAAAFAVAGVLAAASLGAAPRRLAPNPRIDMAGYLKVAQEAAQHRETRRLSEAEFARLLAEPGTLVLDARSQRRYDQLHIRGAVNLSFPDIAVDSVASLIPDQSTRILIYCNNNFTGAEDPFPAKIAEASLNLSTYIALYSYGYRNIYELGPLIDVQKTILPLEGTARK
jgi:phage shock protein E